MGSHIKKSALWLVLAALVVPIFIAQGKLVLVTSESVPHRVLVKAHGVPAKGDYALIRVEHALTDDEPVTLTKKLACYAGEVLEVDHRDYYCEGQYLGRAKRQTLTGTPLTGFVHNGPIPDGYAFALGEHVDSFDSRYWGFVELGLAERLVPLLK